MSKIRIGSWPAIRLGLMGSFLFGITAVHANAFQEEQSNEYHQRREVARSKMEPGSAMILRSDPSRRSSGRFRPDNNFFYRTGIERSGVTLILNSERSAEAEAETRSRRRPPAEILFIPPQRNSAQEDDSASRSRLDGYESVRPASEFSSFYESVLLGSPSVLYFDYQKSRDLKAPLTADEQLLKAARDRGAEFKTKPTSTIISPIRRIKSASEIELIKRAAAITVEAHKEVMRAAQPGMYEYQLQSVIEHVFSFNDAPRPGFSSILGSGPNSCILHWSENTRQINSGDVVVMDIGAEYKLYTADITRTIPINGTFTDRQKDLYEIVLQANEEAIEMIRPGINMRDVSERVWDILTEGLVKLGKIKDKNELRKYYYHGLSHPIGLQVHDVGGLGVLEPGMIITIEPGLYDRDEGIGFRIEDDILVTEDGYVNLTVGAPKSIVDVEAIMKEQGFPVERYLVPKR